MGRVPWPVTPSLEGKTVSSFSSPAFVSSPLLLSSRLFPLQFLGSFSAGPWTPLSPVRGTHFLVNRSPTPGKRHAVLLPQGQPGGDPPMPPHSARGLVSRSGVPPGLDVGPDLNLSMSQALKRFWCPQMSFQIQLAI